jgi:hypothetical protein
MKEKAGKAEESTFPNAPGTVGVGGCADSVSWDGETPAAGDEEIRDASLGTAL